MEENGWRSLPDEMLMKILRYLSYNDCETLSLACKDWNSVLNDYRKNLIVLNFRFVDVNFFPYTKQMYQHLAIPRHVTAEKVDKIFKIMNARTDRIITLVVEHQKSAKLWDILRDCAKRATLQDVSIVFAYNDNEQLPKLKEFEPLNTVRLYKCCGLDSAGFYKLFVNLVVLDFTVQIKYLDENIKCLEELVKQNKSILRYVTINLLDLNNGHDLPFLETIESLEELSIISNDAPLRLRPELFKQNWPLKSLILKPCVFNDEHLRNIFINYKQLIRLVLQFNKHSVFTLENFQNLWRLPNLVSLEYPTFSCANPFPMLINNTVNNKVKHVALNCCKEPPQIDLENAKALESFKIAGRLWYPLSWKHFFQLKVLELDCTFRLSDNPKPLPNLEELILGHYFNPQLNKTNWSNFGTKVKVLRLNSCKRWEVDDMVECLEHFIGIEKLYVTNVANDYLTELIQVISKMPKLEVLHFGLLNYQDFLEILEARPKTLKYFYADLSTNRYEILAERNIAQMIGLVVNSSVKILEMNNGEDAWLLDEITVKAERSNIPVIKLRIM